MTPAPNPRPSLDARLRDARVEAQRQVDDGLIQGAVFALGDVGPIVPVGLQNVHPAARPMTEHSRFDIASVGKTFTAACCALLAVEGRLDPDAPFPTYLPDDDTREHRVITVRDLAMHVGGFNNAKPYASPDPAVLEYALFHMKPVRPRREAFDYSCANYIFLGKIVERVSGQRLDDFARERLWEPLGMKRTQWTPPGDGPDEVEHWDPHRPAGEHNDPVCFGSPVPLGNGSCFSTVADMRLWVDDMIRRACFPAAYYDLVMTCAFEQGETRRSFGWDMGAAGRPKGLSDRAVFHTGFTGQTMLADPGRDFSAVVLTSRTGDWAEARAGRIRILEKLYGTAMDDGGGSV